MSRNDHLMNVYERLMSLTTDNIRTIPLHTAYLRPNQYQGPVAAEESDELELNNTAAIAPVPYYGV